MKQQLRTVKKTEGRFERSGWEKEKEKKGKKKSSARKEKEEEARREQKHVILTSELSGDVWERESLARSLARMWNTKLIAIQNAEHDAY